MIKDILEHKIQKLVINLPNSSKNVPKKAIFIFSLL